MTTAAIAAIQRSTQRQHGITLKFHKGMWYASKAFRSAVSPSPVTAVRGLLNVLRSQGIR